MESRKPDVMIIRYTVYYTDICHNHLLGDGNLCRLKELRKRIA